MLIRFLPLLLIVLSLNCLVGASGQEEAPQSTGNSGFSSNAEASSSSLVLIATVTPISQPQAETRLAALASPTPTTTPAASPTFTATATSTGVLTTLQALDTDTPEPTETATTTPQPTGTPNPTDTATGTPTATRTATPSPTSTKTPVPSLTPTATQRASNTAPYSGMDAVESAIFQAHNQIRSDHGLPMFAVSAKLMTIARERAETMAASGNFSHYNPDGTNVFDMMNAIGYSYVTGSENIHYNYGYPPQQSWQVAMDAWLNSPPHYASMVNPALGHIGIGVATASDGYVYYSIVFSD